MKQIVIVVQGLNACLEIYDENRVLIMPGRTTKYSKTASIKHVERSLKFDVPNDNY